MISIWRSERARKSCDCCVTSKSKNYIVSQNFASGTESLHQKGPSVKSLEYANNWVKKLVIYYNITATLCKSFCDDITRER